MPDDITSATTGANIAITVNDATYYLAASADATTDDATVADGSALADATVGPNGSSTVDDAI